MFSYKKGALNRRNSTPGDVKTDVIEPLMTDQSINYDLHIVRYVFIATYNVHKTDNYV